MCIISTYSTIEFIITERKYKHPRHQTLIGILECWIEEVNKAEVLESLSLKNTVHDKEEE